MNQPVDAYRYPQQVRPGCQHQLGCRCTPPYWLRPSTAAERRHEALMSSPEEFDYERLKDFAP